MFTEPVQLFAIKTDGGMPIFSRYIGTSQTIPYSTISALNGVFVFSNSNSVELQSCTSQNGSTITWKNYNNIITLILITTDEEAENTVMFHILDIIYNCLILHLGTDLITSPDNYERLKKESKICFPLIDVILEYKRPEMVSVLTLCSEVTMAPESITIQTRLEAFSDSINCPLSAIFVKGHMVGGSQAWQELSHLDCVLVQKLISLRFLNHFESASTITTLSREIIVFLPDMSPKIPLRLLVFSILADIDICFICGEDPTLDFIAEKVESFWQISGDDLRSVNSMPLKCLPSGILLDGNLLSLLIVNVETKKCLLCYDSSKYEEPGSRSDFLLMKFYEQNMTSFCPPKFTPAIKDPSLLCNLSHQINDVYSCTPTNKLYAFRQGQRNVFCVYRSTVPTFAIREISYKLLKTLLKNKWFQM